MLSSFFWTYALMQIPGGMLADRFKPRIVIAVRDDRLGLLPGDRRGLHQLGALLLTRLGLGAAEAPIYPAGGKLNAIWMTQNERGRGATLLDGGAPLGAALGAIIIAWLIAALGLMAHWPSSSPASARYLPASWPGSTSATRRANIPASTRPRQATSKQRTRRGCRHRPQRLPAAACSSSSATARSGACSSAGCASTPCSTAC